MSWDPHGEEDDTARAGDGLPTPRTARSSRRWPVVVALLLGLGPVVLVNVGYVVADHRGGSVFLLGGMAGGAVALVAGATHVVDLVVSGGDSPRGDAAD